MVSGDDWYLSTVSEVPCSCGAELWGQDWWDGWTDDVHQEVECTACGAKWSVELEYQEPLVISRNREVSSGTSDG